jgi:DoxX-like family
MFVAAVIVSILLATALVFAAARKLTHAPDVVEGYARARVPESRLNQLATVLFAGATGLVVGLWWPPVGVAAAVGVFCYFIVAIGFHIRAGDVANLPIPVALAGMAALAAGLRVVTI